MSSFNNIVVGLDISNNAKEVLSRAFLVAKRNNSKVAIVHAVDVGFFGSFISDEKINKLKESAIKGIEKKLYGVDTQDIEYSITVEKADPSDFVMKIAKDIDAYLIVMGANEKKGFTTTILGSTAHKIAQNSNLPILIVKNNSKVAYKNIVAFTDLSEISLKSLTFSKELFHQEDIKCVYAYKVMSEIALRYYNQFEYKDEIELAIQTQEKLRFDEFIEQNSISNAEIIKDSVGIASAITDFVNKNNNDLVVLGSKGVNSAGSFLYGSTTSSLMQSLKSDVLVYIPKI